MSWTALLEKRRFPAHARIIADVPCAGCGYNLRGISPTGRCPECGLDITRSLVRLADPDHTADGLAALAKSYFGLGAIVLLCLPDSAPAMVILAALLAWAATYRLIGARALRYEASLEALPVIGPRVRLLWLLTLVECSAMALAMTVLLAAAVAGPGPGAQAVIIKARIPVVVLWVAGTCIGMLVAGLMGGALAGWLERRRITIELRAQRILLLLSIISAVVAWPAANLALSGMLPAAHALILSALVVIAPFALAAGFTISGLLHLSMAAQLERDELEDVVDPGRTEPMHQPAEKEEEPEIRLEEKRRPRA